MLRLIPSHARKYLPAVRELYREYAASIEVDLCFQNFEQELAELPGHYAPPAGRLFLAQYGDDLAGCAALRPLPDPCGSALEGCGNRRKSTRENQRTATHVCEMKRLYVRPAFRGQGIGRKLAQAVIDAAREIGYARMRLDTLAGMKEALALYESLGFRRTAPYYHNPSACAVFMELELNRPRAR